jgi:PAS domain S-box-containing protein
MEQSLNFKKIDPTSHHEWLGNMFEPLIDSVDVGVYVLDCQGIIRRVNKYVLEHYVWETKELIGQNIFELMPDLNEMGIEENFKLIIRDAKARELTNLQREDHLGRSVIFNIKGVPIIENGGVKGVLVVMNDITEQRALESHVAETEEYLQSLIDNANDIIYTLDTEGYITFLNKMGQEITGYRFEPQERGHYTEYVVKSDLPKSNKYFQLALQGKPQRYESAIIAIDGRIVNVLINITPIKKEDEIVGVLGITRDITERKQMEAQLLQASKMAAIGELAAGVAHEINNPVAVISGTAEQLEFLVNRFRERPEEMGKRLQKHIEIIREQANRCKKITQGLLNFARRTEIQAVEVNIGKLIEEVAALLRSRAIAEKKEIRLHTAPDLPLLNADPHLLEQIFLNLTNNALDALPEFGTVTIKARAESGSLIVEVADNGIGIPKENLEKIFDPFFTTKPIGKGTGLGLSICFGIVQRINGTISVRSQIGKGTTFTVIFPTEQWKYDQR